MSFTKCTLVRKPSTQRAVALFVDQEERIKEIEKSIGKKIGLTDLVREGVDRILEELECE